MDFSVCILVNKWHDKLPDVIRAVEPIAPEILLGINGDFRPENHLELQQFPKLKFVYQKWSGFGATKNELANQAQNDWILSLDSDEVVNAELKQSLQNADLSDPQHIFTVSMLHFLAEIPLHFGSWGKGKKQFLRFYNRRFTEWDEMDVHETIKRPTNTKLIPLKGKVHHFTAKNYADFIEKNKYYAKLSAEKYHKQEKNISFLRKYMSAAFNFLKGYIFQLGFLDGKAGWQVAKGNMLYTFWKYKG